MNLFIRRKPTSTPQSLPQSPTRQSPQIASPTLDLLDSSDFETPQFHNFSFKNSSSSLRPNHSIHIPRVSTHSQQPRSPDLTTTALLETHSKFLLNSSIQHKLSSTLSELDTFTREDLADGAAFVHSTRPRARARILKCSDPSENLNPNSNHLNGILTQNELRDRWIRLLSTGTTAQILKIDNSAFDELNFLLKQGIPSDLRAKVWMQLSGADEERRKHKKDYYSNLCELASKHQSVAVDDINKDISRTLPTEPLFAKGDGREKLTRVLTCWAIRKKEVGYAQGINQIAGCLLTILDEESAFWMFSQMIEQRIGYYCKSMSGLEVDERVLLSLLSYYCTDITTHLTKNEVVVQSFSVSWLICLYCESPLCLADTIKLWDHIFVYGDSILFQFAISLLKSKEKEILQTKDAGELLDFLLHAGIRSNIDVLSLLSSPIPNLVEQIASLREMHCAHVLQSATILNSNTAERLAKQYRFPSSSEVKVLWESFLKPAPWPILLHSAIDSIVRFTRAFTSQVFSSEQTSKWKDHGLLSGVFQRLFELTDTTASQSVSFTEYLSLVYIFKYGTSRERFQFCFRFYDLTNSGFVNRRDLIEIFQRFHLLINGHSSSSPLSVCELFADMIETKARQLNGTPLSHRGIPRQLFKQLINLHPQTQQFFGLPFADQSANI